MSDKTDAEAIEQLARAIFEKEAPPGLVWDVLFVIRTPGGLTMASIGDEEREGYRRLAAAQITGATEEQP
ncbi:MAG: hypothetical protein JWM36_3210 [Hyphomicrobiales bacterium]|nr:hypothetical protein [Hyphomicrobiales bacterium]